uniref:Uncharacterized protein n=2 Tax=Oxyrrhis marina TaxID=2969 RepID=A0A7S3UND9_OXYMA
MGECKLLGGAFAIAVQLVLFVTTLAVMYGRKRCGPERSWPVFLLDSSKQYMGAGYIHLLNLALAEKLKSMYSNSDPCNWYAVNLALDCTLGVFFTWQFLGLSHVILKMLKFKLSDFEVGRYDRSERYSQEDGQKAGGVAVAPYFKQLMVWFCVVTAMKLCMLAIMMGLEGDWQALSSFLLDWLNPYPKAKLVAVMCVVPAIFNGLQFWLQDMFLAAKTTSSQLSAQRGG